MKTRRKTFLVISLAAVASALPIGLWRNSEKAIHRQSETRELFRAIFRHDLGRLDFLLSNGADPNAVYAGTPESWAYRLVHIFGGRRKEEASYYRRAEEISFKEQTPLTFASAHADLACAEKLLSYGAAIDAKNTRGMTPLIEAVCSARLLEDGDYFYHAPETLKTVNCLIQHHADVNAADAEGRTPLWHARSIGKIKLVTQLQERGAHE